MKVKSFAILIVIYIISFIAIKTNLNLFYPYYILKDIIFFPVKAYSKEVRLESQVIDGINEELKDEFDELKRLNDLSNTLVDFKSIKALVIERNKMYWFNTITINKGKSSGLKEDMAVITGSGLIGKINKVGSNTSEVKLITTNDTNYKISVMIKTSTDTIYGIMSGYDVSNNKLLVTSVNKNIEIEENASVYTSGMGGVFPSGILIGSVDGVIPDKYDVSKIILVKPNADMNNTRFVNVLVRNIE